MGVFDTDIDAEQYRVDASNFEVVDRESSPYLKISVHLEDSEGGQSLRKFGLDGPGEKWKQQVVYTAGLDLSDRSDQTVPIFEIGLPSAAGFQNISTQTHPRDNEMSAYASHIRSLFVEEDNHGRLQGLGPIGKCLLVSQEQDVILFLRGIDRVPGQTQSMFFGVLDRTPSMQYGQTLEGDAKHLTVFTTSDSTADREELDYKLRRLRGPMFRQE